MTFTYTSISYCAQVESGNVKYHAEYVNEAGNIIYILRITEAEYVKAVTRL